MKRVFSIVRRHRCPKKSISTSGKVPSSRHLHVCIVGSGPAGCYTAEKMLKSHKDVDVDIIDRLPTPFGLVRSGVAPDHPETKIVVNQFSRTMSNERCSFFGNVCVGSGISLSDLRDLYDVVVLAYGAESDRTLSICGENLAGIHSAREFVWWYNGHPDFKNFAPDLSHETAVVFGLGNVALDVARILLRPPSVLANTDIADHALEALSRSSVRKVYIIGRRGPAQAACTAKELREILRIKDIRVQIQHSDLSKSSLDEEDLKRSRLRKRVYGLFSEASSTSHSHHVAAQRELHFVFFRKPVKFLPFENGTHVASVCLEKTRLEAENGGSSSQLAVGTGLFENINCGLALKSIGYKSLPLEGLPFDDERGVVPNVEGRVLSDTSGLSKFENGLYAVGWLKRGPTGIIGSNLYCAEETVRSISDDLAKYPLAAASGLQKRGREGLLQILQERNIQYVPFSGWEKIDSREKSLGSLKNRSRAKITAWDELLRVAKG